MANTNEEEFNLDQFEALAKETDGNHPEFDIVFQQGLLKLAIEDDHFSSQLVRYLGNDKDLKEYTIFDNEQTQQIFQMIVDSLKKYSTRPTEGQLRQQIKEQPEKLQEGLTAALNGILKVKTHNDAYYRKHIGKFVQQCKFFKGMLKVKKLSSDFSDEAIKHMEEVINDIYRVNFEKEDVLILSDFDKYYNEVLTSSDATIPTGITAMDKDMLGGLPRGGLVTVLAGTNVGKSIFVTSLGCQAIKAKDQNGNNRKLKIFHLNFEGRANATLFRYMSNLAQVSYRNITLGNLSPEEMSRMQKVQEDFGDQFKIRNFAGSFGKTIQEVYSYCREVYKDFKFDMLIVDYGQLLETTRKVESQRHVLADVFRGLDSMAKEFHAVVISPAQATRSGQESQNQHGKGFGKFQAPADQKLPVLRSSDISEAFEIARVSEVILSLNRTDDEVDQQKLRIFLEKQREGSKNKSYGVITNYPMSDVITGKYYDPMAKGSMENEKPEEFEKIDLNNISKEKKDLQKDPEVSDSDDIEYKRSEMDSLISEYKDIDKKENGKRLDYNQELKKADKNMDIVNQYSQDLEKYKKFKMEIVKKAQELIKVIYPEASEVLLKTMEKSYKDLIKSGASEDQIISQEVIINRYKLGLKGKL